MAVNTTAWEATLQTKLNDTTLTSKDMLLVGKTLEATTGNIAVSDVNTAGATQVAAIASAATSTFKTVGGTSILGSGNIESLPAGGSVGQQVTNTGSGTGSWQTTGMQNIHTITSSTTYTVPAGVRYIKVTITGAGGNGGSAG